jgi:hypothetical protein
LEQRAAAEAVSHSLIISGPSCDGRMIHLRTLRGGRPTSKNRGFEAPRPIPFPGEAGLHAR